MAMTLPAISKEEWVPDSMVSACQACGTQFSVTTRRHHCRSCGRIYCDKCCGTRAELSDGSESRVCSTCLARASASATSVVQPTNASGSASRSASPPQPTAQSAISLPPNIEENLQKLIKELDINPIFLPSLRNLFQYDIAAICDDSGSMSAPADQKTPTISRWMELKQSMQILIRIASAFEKSVDVYFLNRGAFRNVQNFEQVHPAFTRPPNGGTNTVRNLNQVWTDKRVTADMPRRLAVYIFTDGHPTNQYGSEDMYGFEVFLRNRVAISRTFLSIILCTDEEEVCNMYRPLEHRMKGQLGWKGPTTGVQGVDVTEDYRGELKYVKALRGENFHYSVADYVVKCMMSAIDPAIQAVELPEGTCIYGDNGGCCIM